MSDSELLRTRQAAGRAARGTQYTARDFQLEMLEKLAETEALVEAMQKSWKNDLQAVKDQRLLKFDSQTLVAVGAIALSVTGYVLQEARNTARQDTELETTRARVTRLEQIAATNTEARVRTEVQLGELHEGQAEIKQMIEAHDNRGKKSIPPK